MWVDVHDEKLEIEWKSVIAGEAHSFKEGARLGLRAGLLRWLLAEVMGLRW